jgi:hypothetical protein
MVREAEQSASHTPSAWTCPSCGSVATARYCGNCGEERSSDRAFAGVASEGEPKRTFTSRIRVSLAALVGSPGKITADWLAGRRIPYLAPLSLFLWTNVVFFLVQSITGLGILTWPLRIHLADDSITWITTRLLAWYRPDLVATTAAYAPIFDALEAVHAKSLVIVMIPAFALVLGAMTIDCARAWRRSFIFATHFFAFTLLWLSLLFPALALGLRVAIRTGLPTPVHHSFDLAVTGVEAAVVAWYLYVALGAVFNLSGPRRALTIVVLIGALYAILKAYHVVVFAVTLYST